MPVTLTILLLVAWAGGITLLVHLDPAEDSLGTPLFLAIAGVFSSLLPLAFSPGRVGFVNGAILLVFLVSLEGSRRHRSARALVRHRA